VGLPDCVCRHALMHLNLSAHTLREETKKICRRANL
jgi:hypothetical protein